MKTLFVLNPHAGNGSARHIWTHVETLLKTSIEDYAVVVTETIEAIAPLLHEAVSSGAQRIIAIGGDGTNHSVINEVLRINAEQPGSPLEYGNVPIGTGRDWARGLGVPIGDIPGIAKWITSAVPQPIDIGMLTYEDTGVQEYFLNIASGGLGGDVAHRMNNHVKRPWSFYLATVQSMLDYTPQHISVMLDGVEWYNDKLYLVAIANGKIFGRGMVIAPNALVDDGLFDIILAKNTSRFALLTTLQKVYSGTHLTHPAVMQGRAKQIRLSVQPNDPPLRMELDGEFREGRSLIFEVRPGLLKLLR